MNRLTQKLLMQASLMNPCRCYAARLILLLASLPLAADELNYNLYSLSVESHQTVANDLMKVTLVASHQDDRASEVANRVNESMTTALQVLKKQQSKPQQSRLKYETGQYRTMPVYRNSKVTGWRATQELQLEGEDFKLLTQVLSQLQKNLTLSSMTFEPKKKTKKSVEDQLISDALKNFRDRATLITRQMAASKYTIVKLTINTDPNHQPVFGMRSNLEAVAGPYMKEAAVASGESTVTVSINGQIQLEH